MDGRGEPNQTWLLITDELDRFEEYLLKSMIGENWQLVTHEPVELRNNRLKLLQYYCTKNIDHLGGIYKI